MGKACIDCGEVKELTEFYEHPQMADGYLNRCIPCHREDGRRRRAIRMSDPEQRERERDRMAAWRAAHPDQWKAARHRANAKFYGTVKQLQVRAVRKARKGGRELSVVVLRRVLETHGRHCHICDKPIALTDDVHFDHVIPLARGGAHAEDNLRPAHRSCNAWKGDRLDSELVGLTPPTPEEIPAYVRELRRARRSEQARARMAALTPEQRAERARKISEAKRGRKMPPGHRAGGARNLTPEQHQRRIAATRAAYAAWTPERRAAHAAKVSAGKRAAGNQGNIENLRKGWAPEVHAKAIAASAELRRGQPESEAHRAAISDALKRAHAEGRMVKAHTEETKRKISDTKRRKREQS